MSLGLQATKRRITSVNSTKKITKAMQLVATAKLKTMKKNLTSTSAYADEVALVMASLVNRMEAKEFASIFNFGVNNAKGTAYLIISSSLGLCGGYNYALFKEITPLIDKENDIVVVVGSKAEAYFTNRGYKVNNSHVDALNDFSYQKVDYIIKDLLSLYATNQVNKIKVGYTHYKNQITFIPKVTSLYPFDFNELKVDFSAKEKNMLVEPDAVSIAQKLMPLYLKSIIYSRMNESLLSEYSSRRNAMENATDNAEELVSELQIEYNKARQGAITQEITEVVGGANASK